MEWPNLDIFSWIINRSVFELKSLTHSLRQDCEEFRPYIDGFHSQFPLSHQSAVMDLKFAADCRWLQFHPILSVNNFTDDHLLLAQEPQSMRLIEEFSWNAVANI